MVKYFNNSCSVVVFVVWQPLWCATLLSQSSSRYKRMQCLKSAGGSSCVTRLNLHTEDKMHFLTFPEFFCRKKIRNDSTSLSVHMYDSLLSCATILGNVLLYVSKVLMMVKDGKAGLTASKPGQLNKAWTAGLFILSLKCKCGIILHVQSNNSVSFVFT